MELLPPRYLYKYRAINKNTISNLSNETLYFASYEQLNDPSEFCFNISDSIIDEKDEIKQKMINPFFKLFSCSENNSIILENIDNNILLWSHYADSHKGICIEYERYVNPPDCIIDYERYTNPNDKFDFIDYPNRFSKKNAHVLLKVRYNSDVFTIKHKNPVIVLSNFVGRKFSQWQYENEWRFLNTNLANNNIPLTECFSRISSVIFGVNTSEQNKKDIIKIFEHKPEKPDFKQAVWDDKESFLRIVEYVPNV